jgi:ribose transport system permease protein
MTSETDVPTATSTPSGGVIAPRTAEAIEDKRRTRRRLETASRFALPSLLVLFAAVFSALKPADYATWSNWSTIFTTQSVLAILALGAMVTLVIGEFDLSLGAQLGLSALLLPGLLSRTHLGMFPAIVISIAATSFVGLINGLLVAKVRLNSFVVTIGMATLISAAVLAYSKGAVIYENVPPSLLKLTSQHVAGVSLAIIYAIVVAILIWVLLQLTPVGRRMEAVGSNRDASRLSGINTDRLTILGFVLAGFLAGIAGVLEASQVGSGNPSVGPDFLLPAFAAAFLGATSFRVGRFNVIGTIVAVVTIAAGVDGLNLLGAAQWVEPAFNGAALLVAITMTRYLRGKPL